MDTIKESLQDEKFREGVESLVHTLTRVCHNAAVEGGWWHDVETGEPLARNDGELISLMHSELSEMLEGVRKNEDDKHLPHRKATEVEAADAIVRILDYCGARGLDVAGALVEKIAYNLERADHKAENRRKENGKDF